MKAKHVFLTMIVGGLSAFFVVAACLGGITWYKQKDCDHVWIPKKVTQEATCEEAGEERLMCEECYKIKHEEIPALGHVDEKADGLCDVCEKALEAEGTTEDAGADEGGSTDNGTETTEEEAQA